MSKYQARGILQLEAAIKAIYSDPIKIEAEELQKISGNKHIVGWKVRLVTAGKCFDVAIVIMASYPFSPPQYYLMEIKENLFKIPHLDDNGFLCLPDCNLPIRDPFQELARLHHAANILIEQGLMGSNREDFKDEFLSYWLIKAKKRDVFFYLKNKKQSRNVIYCELNKSIFFFENERIAKDWLENRYTSEVVSGIKFYNTILVYLEDFLDPDSYPKSGKDVISIIEAHAGQFAEDVKIFSYDSPGSGISIGLMFVRDGVCVYAGVRIFPPQIQRGPLKKLNLKKKSKAKDLSRKILYGNHVFSSSTKVELLSGQRVDPDWLHYRGEAGRNNEINSMTVAILGCGSLGSLVADVLARAGVSDIILFDPEILSWDNIYRHLLGPNEVGINKAKGLKRYLASKYPSMRVKSYSTRWEDQYLLQGADLFTNVDLIISLIGETSDNSELYLNHVARSSPEMPPILMGWTEVWGAAGHVLFVSGDDQGGCISCKDANQSQFKRIFEFDNDDLFSLPACSQSFAPYGYVDVMPLISLIARQALEFLSSGEVTNKYLIWVSNAEIVARGGGKVSEWFVAKYGNLSEAAVVKGDWVHDASCEVCNGLDV